MNFYIFLSTNASTMEIATNSPFGNRLKLARKMAGYSLQDLADALGNQVTKQSLNKYEMGLMNPSGEVLLSIANALRVKPDYFFKQQSLELGQILFRKKQSLSKKQEEAIVEKLRDYIERYLEIEHILGNQQVFENPLRNYTITNLTDIENAANSLRNAWQLGTDPISNIAEMLEAKGIKVSLIEDVDDFDGLAVITSTGIPVVVVNQTNKPTERVRFTILHELAHLLLNFDAAIVQNEKLVETYCHRFASTFLLPTDMLIHRIGYKRVHIRIQELISIKEYFGISIRAIIHRLKDLQVITDDYYRRWNVYLSKEYGGKAEPGNYTIPEKARTFDALVNKALAEEIITMSKAAALWNVSLSEIRNGYAGKD